MRWPPVDRTAAGAAAERLLLPEAVTRDRLSLLKMLLDTEIERLQASLPPAHSAVEMCQTNGASPVSGSCWTPRLTGFPLEAAASPWLGGTMICGLNESSHSRSRCGRILWESRHKPPHSLSARRRPGARLR